MVSSAESLATRVGLSVLERGGNAVDAAAATALALGVTEGYASGIGGGCFILVRMADGTAVCVDGREAAPAAATRLMFVPEDTTSASSLLSTVGLLAVAVPGELAALELAVRTYGRLPFAAAFEGAILLADTGIVVSQRYAGALRTNSALLERFSGSREVFFRGGKPLDVGDRLVQSDLAATLRLIQSGGIDEFYTGSIAQKLAQHMNANGGLITARDMAGYRPLVREPVRGEYHGLTVLSMPPPSSGGVHVIQILQMLDPLGLHRFEAGSPDALHIIAEAMQIAFADRAQYLGDPDFVAVPTSGLVSRLYAEERRSRIGPAHERVPRGGDPWSFVDGLDTTGAKHTTHLCVVDSFGNAVALTATINTPFGCGVIVPGLGFLLNNEMDDFVTWPGRPNYFGLVGNAMNEIEPGKRPLSSMSPTILLRDNRPFIVIGSMGGPRIITSVVLSLLNVFEFGMNLQEAVDAPRIHQQWSPDVLYVEPEHPNPVLDALRQHGHAVRSQPRWAAVTAIMADTTRSGWWGAADSRVAGHAKGF